MFAHIRQRVFYAGVHVSHAATQVEEAVRGLLLLPHGIQVGGYSILLMSSSLTLYFVSSKSDESSLCSILCFFLSYYIQS